jgi:hypothetical protein
MWKFANLGMHYDNGPHIDREKANKVVPTIICTKQGCKSNHVRFVRVCNGGVIVDGDVRIVVDARDETADG